MEKNKERELIEKVGKEISDLMPDCCGVTLGGSRCYEVNDEHSDVEMYFYTHDGPPAVERITDCLLKMNAKHKRTDSFLWENEMPWGPHSFFVIDDLYFEIGYRNIDNIRKRIEAYKSGIVAPQGDCHDLGLGYMPSGLSASVTNEKLMLKVTKELLELKRIAGEMSPELLSSLKSEYFDTATSLIEGKLLSAVERGDMFFYESISGRITRCLMVMAFAICHKDFPGDKWNEILLMRTDWQDKEEFINLLKEHINYQASNTKELSGKRKVLLKAYDLVKKDLGGNE